MKLSPLLSRAHIKNVQLKTLHDGFFKLVRLSYSYTKFQGGQARSENHEVLLRPQAVVVIGYDLSTEQVVLIEQLRSGLVACGAEQPWLIEVVAGLCEPDEAAHLTARRELQEETGLDTKVLIPIASYWVSPGGSSEKVHAYCALVDSSKAQTYAGLASEGENIAIRKFPRTTLEDALSQGILNNSATILCTQWLALNHENIKNKVNNTEKVDEWIYF